jgi:ABC-type nitrate/sulfonate/bicarbonate transport system substrate-binding protein
MKNNRFLWILLSIALLTAFITGCSRNETPNQTTPEVPLAKTTVILDWTPNTNHTGLYVALENGYYEEEGLDVEIIQPSDAGSTVLVATGRGDFGVSYQEDVTLALTNQDPLPIKAIATILQENTSGFASPANKNIQSVLDFEGKTYGGWGSPTEEAILTAVMKKNGLDYLTLSNVDIGTDDFFAATRNNIDFAWVFEGWTVIESKLRDIPLNYIALKDLDPALNYYTPILVTNNKLIDEDPEKIRKFLRATQKGYEYAIEFPEESARILLAYAPEINEELAIDSQIFLGDYYASPGKSWGKMEASVWDAYTQFLLENDLIQTDLNAEDAFTNEFLPQ